jgi:hypothetical protein
MLLVHSSIFSWEGAFIYNNVNGKTLVSKFACLGKCKLCKVQALFRYSQFVEHSRINV